MQQEHVNTLVALAEQHRTATILYRKLNERTATVRIIEPYRLLEHDDQLSLHAWQLRPPVNADLCWRTFRCDRIEDISDGGEFFKPRRPVTIHTGECSELMSLFREKPKTAVDRYRDYLFKAIRDRLFTDEERSDAENFAQKVSTTQMKVVHAQVFSEVLFDVLLDHHISDDEDEFLSNVRGFMDTVGWSP
jgi:hypothetical protein